MTVGFPGRLIQMGRFRAGKGEGLPKVRVGGSTSELTLAKSKSTSASASMALLVDGLGPIVGDKPVPRYLSDFERAQNPHNEC
jgi:hypothetical protein